MVFSVKLVGCFRFNGPLRQYFSIYRAVSQREGEIGEKRKRGVKMSKQPTPAPTANTVDPFPTVNQIVGRPGPGRLSRTIAPPDDPRLMEDVNGNNQGQFDYVL